MPASGTRKRASSASRRRSTIRVSEDAFQCHREVDLAARGRSHARLRSGLASGSGPRGYHLHQQVHATPSSSLNRSLPQREADVGGPLSETTIATNPYGNALLQSDRLETRCTIEEYNYDHYITRGSGRKPNAAQASATAVRSRSYGSGNNFGLRAPLPAGIARAQEAGLRYETPARIGNIWGGFDHEPIESEVQSAERARGVAPSAPEQRQETRIVEQLFQEVLKNARAVDRS